MRLTWPGAGLFVDHDYLVTGETTKLRENGATTGVGVLATFAYDNLGRRTSLTRGNGAVTTYGYDPGSRLSLLVENLTGTTHDQTLGFTYNPASQIATSTRSNDLYAWGGHYNIDRPYTANGLNQYSATGSIIPTYDTKGNLTSAGSIAYGGYGGGYGGYGYNQGHGQADLKFSCRVDYRGRITDIDLDRRHTRYGYRGY